MLSLARYASVVCGSKGETALVSLILVLMARKFNPFPDPKRGKGRAVLKRPAYQKNQAWKKVAYTRDKLGKELRADQHSWKRSLPELLAASESSLIKKLREDKLLPSWEKRLCPRCEKGTLSKLQPHPGSGALKHRCNHYGCQAYISPHHMHPLFVDGRGKSTTPLATQCCLLLLKLNNVSHAAIHRLLKINHKVSYRGLGKATL